MSGRTSEAPAAAAPDVLAHRYGTVVRVAYPRVERASHGDELVGDAVALARPGQRWPSAAIALDLLRQGFAARLRPANLTSQLTDFARLVHFGGRAGRDWARANMPLVLLPWAAVILGAFAVVHGIAAASSPSFGLAGLALFAAMVLVTMWSASRSWPIGDAHGARQATAFVLAYACAFSPGTILGSPAVIVLWPLGTVAVYLAVVCIGAAHAARRGLESPPVPRRA